MRRCARSPGTRSAAGRSSAIGIIVGAILLVFLILLMTDLLGLTKSSRSSTIRSEPARHDEIRHRRCLPRAGRAVLLAGCATPEWRRSHDPRPAAASRGRGRAVPSAAGAVLRPGGARHGARLVGAAGAPEALAREVFTPGREGTLGHDLVGAARRHGRLAVPVADLPSLLGELAAGHPVLVLQNLALDWYPQWHFAVAIGYDLSTGKLTLRSGEELRQVVSLIPSIAPGRARTIGRWWCCRRTRCRQSRRDGGAERSGGLEHVGRLDEAALAYAPSLRRWPDSLGALIGRGNARYAARDLDGAEAAYRAALGVILELPRRGTIWPTCWRRGAADGCLIAARRASSSAARMQSCYRRTLAEITGTPA